MVLSDGRTAEGRLGGHGGDVFAVPPEPLPDDPQDALTVLNAAGARTVLLAAGRDLAAPFLARGLVDDVVVHLRPVSVELKSLDPALPLFDLPAGFRIAQVARSAEGLRTVGVAARGR